MIKFLIFLIFDVECYCEHTISGKSCLRWSRTSSKWKPSGWGQYKPYCANPDNDPNGNWCYTSDSTYGKSWDYCPKSCSADGSPSTPTAATPSPSTPTSLEPVCGRLASSPLEASSRVYGGENAKRGEVPWQVFLRSDQCTCGGTLINMKTVISAAHCISDNCKTRHGEDLEMFAGNIKRYEWWDDPKIVQKRVANKIVRHPYYNSNTYPKYANDIAIIIPDSAFKFNDYVRPACLPGAGYEVSSRIGIVSGFGRTEKGWIPELQRATLEILSQTRCKSSWGRQFESDKMICALERDIDTCQGDSGGPLIVNENGKHTLYGITSFGIGCAIGKPGVYTKVSKYLRFINQHIEGNPPNSKSHDLIPPTVSSDFEYISVYQTILISISFLLIV